MNILDAINDRNLFERWFRDRETWTAWRAFLAATFALPMGEAEEAIYRECTGRSEPPEGPAEEAWLICGRRAGKSRILALIGTFLAAFRNYREYLSPGERGVVLIVATDRRQSRVIFRYVRSLLTETPMLAKLIARETNEEFDLTNGVSIEVATSSFRSIRGRTVVAGLCDELAFWPSDDSSEPDYAILDAIRPGMATIPSAILLCASSPYARRGALWDAHQKHFGRDGDPILVWQASSKTMNPLIPDRVISAAYERDPASAAAEFGAEFRADVEAFVSREVVERAIEPGMVERSPLPGKAYRAFVDPSGGASDSMTLAIAHPDGDRIVLAAVRERRAPFSPESVVSEFAALLHRYGLRSVTGDRYGGEWPREAFRRHGVEYRLADKPKSALYLDFLARLNSNEAALLDVPAIRDQLIRLERRTSRGGRDTIDHPSGGRDDVANAVAGVMASKARQPLIAQTSRYVVARGPLPGAPLNPLAKANPPPWFANGDRYPPGDFRWRLDHAKGLLPKAKSIELGFIKE